MFKAESTPPSLGGILVIDDDPDARSTIASVFPDGLRPLPGPLTDLREVCRTGRSGVVVLGPSFATEALLGGVEALDLPSRGLLGVLVTDDPDPGILRAALRAGLRDVVSLPGLAPVLEHLAAVAAERTDEAHAPSDLGRVIAVASAKGGAGATTIAVNLAAEYAARGSRVVVIDADLQFGDAALHLGVRPAGSLLDAQSGPKLTPRRLDSLLSVDESTGVRVLSAPLDPAAADLVDPSTIAVVIDLAAQIADIVIIDTTAGLTQVTLNVLELADRIALVTAASLGSLRGAKAELGALSGLHFAAKTSLIVNRLDADHEIGRRQLADWARVPVAGYLPECHEVVTADARSTAVLDTAPHSKFAGALAELADTLAPELTTQRTTAAR